MNWDELFDVLDRIRCSPLGQGRRAKHKPLLLLWALGRWRQNIRQVTFNDWAEAYSRNLRHLVVPHAGDTPEMPFCKLQHDTTTNPGCLWKVRWDRSDLPDDASVTELRDAGAVASFSAEVQALLSADATRVTQVADHIMDQHFPLGEVYTRERRAEIRRATEVAGAE